MRCKSCDYPLWNIKARQCPECGAEFLPSSYDFVINSVQFCCPHCQQVYYGTGVRGHLVPREFNCITCGQRVHMDQMLLRPAEGISEDQTLVERMPWLERTQRGFIKAWMATVGRSMVNPASLMRAVPVDQPLSNAWWYAAITWLIILLFGAGIPLLGLGAIVVWSGDSDGYEMMVASPIVVGGGIVSILVLMAIWGAIAHAALRITGGCEHSLGRTYQAILYSAGVNAPLAIPCVGPYCGTYLMWIWWGISATLMLAQGQRVHGGRAALACFAFPGMAIAGFMALLVVSIVLSARTSIPPFQVGPASEISAVTSAIIQHASANNGSGPAHALELLTSANLATPNFTSMFTGTDPARIQFAGAPLDQIDYLAPNRQRLTIQSVASAMPANTIAHRCGDFVFTYHGIDLRTADPGLWVVVFSPDPTFNQFVAAVSELHVGRADGTTAALTGSISAELARQNQLRASYNLAPLPHPATVTHQNPAVAGP